MYQSPYSNPNPLDKSPFFYTPNNLLLKPFSPSFRNPSPIKEKPNLSNAETSDYLTPRIEAQPKGSNSNIRLNHLFKPINPQTPFKGSSFYSNSSSYESEPLNYSFNSFKKGGFEDFNRGKSLYVSSNNRVKLQEEQDDEDFILDISKYYIKNIEEIEETPLEQEDNKGKNTYLERKIPSSITNKEKNPFIKGIKTFPEGNPSNFEINLENVNFDGRTTLMIKNIPNKYDLNSILANIRRNHAGKYDFFYLPIDNNVIL